MQRVEINPNLSKKYIQIARGLKEIKETAYSISLAAQRVLPVLQAKKAAGGLSDDEDQLLEDAITHYSAIANSEDAWDIIDTVALETEDSIKQLFLNAINLLQNPHTNKKMLSRLAAYGWITNNIGDLNKLLFSMALSVEEAATLQYLYKPVPRMGHLKLFLDNFKNALTDDQKKLLEVINPLHAQATQIAARMDRLATSNVQAAQFMIQKLDFFSPLDVNKELYECELEDLAVTISTVDPVGNFKERLEQLHARIKDDVNEQKIEGKTTDEITHSPAMQLCRNTHKMLDVVHNKKKTPDEKLDAIKSFQDACDQTSGGFKFLKWVAAVAIAAVVTVLVAAAIVGIAAIIGTLFGGPAGTVAGAVAGLVEGTVTAAGIGIATASLVTGITVSCAVSPFTIFKKDNMKAAADNVAEEALDYKDYVPVASA